MQQLQIALVQTAFQKSPAAMREHLVDLCQQAAAQGASLICLQELCLYPYFPAHAEPTPAHWAESVPGPTVARFRKLAKELGTVIIVPLYEKAATGVCYNTAAVIDQQGRYLGKYRKVHVPELPGFHETCHFQPGDHGFPVFQTAFGRVGLLLGYDRHFPEAARLLALGGAQLVLNPCATVADVSQNLWFLEQRALAVANGVFIGSVNRIGRESPDSGVFYGQSYLADPFGEIVAQARQDTTEVLMATVEWDRLAAARACWPFLRDRQPLIYELSQRGGHL